MDRVITPSTLKGEIIVPSSKSILHRALICSAFADCPTTIIADSDCDDVVATINCLNKLGATITPIDDGYFVIPVDVVKNDVVLDCKESGSTFRFLLPIVCALGIRVKFIGEGRLSQRPISELVNLLKDKGITFDGDCLPFSVGGKLNAGIYKIDASVSSQYITGLMLALSILDGKSKIELLGDVVSQDYINITKEVIKSFGLDTQKDNNVYIVDGKKMFFSPQKYVVEGDMSSLSYWAVSGAIGGDILIKDIKATSLQGDHKIIKIIKDFGGIAEYTEKGVEVKKSTLVGQTIDLTDVPDLAPSIAVLGCYAVGKTTLIGVERLRTKESDRLDAIMNTLDSFRIKSNYEFDKLTIYGGCPIGNVIDSYNDHRIAMASTVCGLFASGQTTIKNADCVKKSYPSFFDDLKRLGGKVC